MPVIQATQEAEAGRSKFKASLDNLGRLCLKTKRPGHVTLCSLGSTPSTTKQQQQQQQIRSSKVSQNSYSIIL